MVPSIWPSRISGGHRLLTLFSGDVKVSSWPTSWHTDLQSLLSQGKGKAILWEEFSQPCPSWEGTIPLPSASLCPDLPQPQSPPPSRQGTSCWRWLRSHLVTLPDVPSFPFPRPSQGSVPPEAPPVAVRGCAQTLGAGAPGMHLQTWKISLCILPKHLTSIKVPPRGTNFTY